MARYVQQGKIAADGLCAARGIPAPAVMPAAAVGAGGVAPATVAPVAGVANPPTHVWVCFEDSGGRKRGDVVAEEPHPLPPGSVMIGDHGIVRAVGLSTEPCFVKRVPSCSIQVGGCSHSQSISMPRESGAVSSLRLSAS